MLDNIGRSPAYVRSKCHIRHVEKRAVRGQRLIGKDIEAGSCQLPLAKCLNERAIIEKAGSRGVDQVSRRLHELQLALAYKRWAVLRRRMQGHDV